MNKHYVRASGHDPSTKQRALRDRPAVLFSFLIGCTFLTVLCFWSTVDCAAQTTPTTAPTPIVPDEDIDPSTYTGPIRLFRKPKYKEDSPRLEFDQPGRVYDFGTVPQQSSKNLLITIRNAGKSDLIINKIDTTWGCTAAMLTGNTVLPGQTGELKVTIETGNHLGPMKKNLRLFTNDPVIQSVKLILSAQVEFVYTLDQLYVSFGSISKKQLSTTRTVMINSKPDLDFKLVELTSSNPDLELKEIRTENDKRAIEVSLKKSLPYGPFEAIVTLRTDCAAKPSASFKISGYRLGVISGRPLKMLFHQTDRQLPVTQTLTLTHVETRSFNILKVEPKTPPDFESDIKKIMKVQGVVKVLPPVASDLTWEIVPQQNSPGSIKLKLTFHRPLEEGQVVYGLAALQTDDPEQKEVLVPFYGYRGNFNPLQHRIKSKTASQEGDKARTGAVKNSDKSD
ncbi:DUF1573 domain-containing protein [bacterium]|nr:DUF1573 domain-containing protein [bacterium]